jgi:hypothetical protein
MMDALNISELRAKIAASRKLLDEQERALDLVEALASGSTAPMVAVRQSNEPSKSGNVQIPQLPQMPQLPRSRVPRSQKEILKEAIAKFDGKEFTVGMLDDVLMQSGNRFEGEKPRSRIAVLMGQLVDENFIKRTQEGGGNVPHRYQKA